jgi:hypothetical protein
MQQLSREKTQHSSHSNMGESFVTDELVAKSAVIAMPIEISESGSISEPVNGILYDQWIFHDFLESEISLILLTRCFWASV